MMTSAEKYVLRTCAQWLQEQKNGGWTSFPRPSGHSTSAIRRADEEARYAATRRLEACGLLEMKLDGPYEIALFRLRPLRAIELVVTDETLFPEGDLVELKETKHRGVLVEYSPKAESFPYLVQLDGERSRSSYSLREIQAIPREEFPHA